jgi:hypothetical protein
MARPLPLGDVVEIATPLGLFYAQAVGRHEQPPRFGTLFRMPARIFDQRPESLPTSASFPFFSPLEDAVGYQYPHVRFARIGVRPVPEEWQSFPIFRKLTFDASLDEVWCLWDGSESRPITDISTEERERYPELRVGAAFGVLFWAFEAAGKPVDEAILRGWLGIPDYDSDTERPGGTTHYLIFETERSARAAAEQLEQFGEVSVDGGSESWTVVLNEADGAFDDPEKADTILSEIAEALGGSYDGRETAV